MTIGYLQINGSGPRNAGVGIFDETDNLIVECQSDARGFWSVSSVPMEVGTHQLRAKMRSENGREHISNFISVEVLDPDADVEIQAKELDPIDVAVMEELEQERQERAAIRAAFERYDQLVELAVEGYEVSTSELACVLGAVRGDHDAFWGEVESKIMRNTYARLVLEVAAGHELSDKDRKSVWREYGKSEEEFEAAVDKVRYSAGYGWNTSLPENRKD